MQKQLLVMAMMVFLSACATPATVASLDNAKADCIYGNATACEIIPALEAQASSERSANTTSVVAGVATAVILLPLFILLGADANNNNNYGHYHHHRYR